MNSHDANALKVAELEAAANAIKALGGPVEAAKKVGAPSYQSVQSWAQSGVPAKYCRKVSELTGMALPELRPRDWSEFWSELAQSSTSTKEVGNA